MALFEDVTRFIDTIPYLVHSNGATEEEIHRLRVAWNMLPLDYEAFLRKYGWLEFGATEVPGLGALVPTHLNVLAQAHDAWNSGISHELLPIYNPYSGWLYCLKYQQSSVSVVVYSFDLGETYGDSFSSWSDWFLWMFSESS